MKIITKIFTISFILIAIFSFSACEQQKINDNNENESMNINNDVLEVEEDSFKGEIIDVSYMSPLLIGAETEENSRYIQNRILNQFGINISLSATSGEDKPGIDLLVAGNGLPDCGWVYCSPDAEEKAYEYYEGGSIRAIPIENIIEFAPDYYSILQEDPTFSVLLTEEEDSYFSLSAFRYGARKLAWTIIARYDWMKNLGIEPKGEIINLYDYIYITDEYYTVSEFTDLIYAFTYSDPNMNNQNDTIGHLIYSDWIWDFPYIPTLCAAYDIRANFSPMENGWGIASDISPGAKKAYMQLSKWLELKVVNTDPRTFGLDSWIEKWGSGKYGTMACFYRYFDRETDPPANLIAKSPDVEILVMPPLVDNDGSGGRAIGYGDFISSPGAGFFYINSAVQDEEKLNRILQFFNWSTANSEGFTICEMGEEGLHYTINEWNNKITILNEEEMLALDPALRVIKRCFNGPVTHEVDEELVVKTSKLDKKTIKEFVSVYWKPESHSYIIAPPARELNLDIDWFQRANKKAKALAFNEFIDRVYEGGADVEIEWENLMRILDELGIQEYLLEINTNAYLYDEYIQGERVTPVEKFGAEYE